MDIYPTQHCPLSTNKAKPVELSCFFTGDFADGLYFIESGEVIVTRSEDGVEREVDRLSESKNPYFGELALITARPRAASVIANGKDLITSFCRVIEG